MKVGEAILRPGGLADLSQEATTALEPGMTLMTVCPRPSQMVLHGSLTPLKSPQVITNHPPRTRRPWDAYPCHTWLSYLFLSFVRTQARTHTQAQPHKGMEFVLFTAWHIVGTHKHLPNEC